MKFLGPEAYIKLDGQAEPCAEGMDTNEVDCRDALSYALSMGITLGTRDKLITGSWDHVPSGCSYEAGKDGAFHFNRKTVSNAVNFMDGTFKMICRQGMKLQQATAIESKVYEISRSLISSNCLLQMSFII